MKATTTDHRPPRHALLHRHRWFSVLAAMLSAAALRGVFESLLGVDLTVRRGSGQQHLGSLTLTLTALVVGLAAWGTLTLLERWTRQARGVWRGMAAVVLLVSLVGPFSAITAEATLALLMMHVVVGAILLVWLPGRGPRGSAQRRGA